MDKKMIRRCENINQRIGLLKMVHRSWCKGKIWEDIKQMIEELEKEYDYELNNNH